MDLKYMMIKNKYRFVQNNKPMLYDINSFGKYQKQMSLLTKELYLFNLHLKQLVKEKPKASIKNELLNIAAICADEESLSNDIKLKRELPVKKLCSLTKKPQSFFQKWNGHILLYFILLSNNNYAAIFSYLQVEKIKSIGYSNLPEIQNKNSDIFNGEAYGIVIKSTSKGAYILTSSGNIYFIFSSEKTAVGELCNGVIKKDSPSFSFSFKFAYIFVIIIIILSFFLYTNDSYSVIINNDFSIKLSVNRWNRITKASGLNFKGNTIKDSTNLTYKPIDDAIVLVLAQAKEDSLINNDSSISVYVSSKVEINPPFKHTYDYIKANNMKVIINNNGRMVTQ